MSRNLVRGLQLFYHTFIDGLSKANNEIMKSESMLPTDAQQTQKMNQGRYQLSEKFLNGVRDEQYVRHFYQVLERADDFQMKALQSKWISLDDMFYGDELDAMYTRAFDMIEFEYDANGKIVLDTTLTPVVKLNSVNQLAEHNLKLEFERDDKGYVKYENGQPITHILMEVISDTSQRLNESRGGLNQVNNVGGQKTDGLVYVKNDRQQVNMFDQSPNPEYESSINIDNQRDSEIVKGVYYNLKQNELLLVPNTNFSSIAHRDKLKSQFERLNRVSNIDVTTKYGKIQNFKVQSDGYVSKDDIRLNKYIILSFHEQAAPNGPKN